MNQTLFESAKTVLASNWTGQFTKPAPSLYPHQWNWDSGFIAMGYAHYDMDKAEAELRKLFDAQWKNGMLPQIVFGEDPEDRYFPGPDFWQTSQAPNAPTHVQTSGITMPPIHGFILWEIYDIADDKDRAKALLKEFFPKVIQLHKYLYENRDPLDEGLVYICHPWESGTDNSPTWDAPLQKMDTSTLNIPPYKRKDLQHANAMDFRPSNEDYDRYAYLVDLFRKAKYEDKYIQENSPFLIQDPLFNALLVWSNEAMIKIGHLIGEDIFDVILWNELTIHSMNEKMWDPEMGLYHAYDLKNQELIKKPTTSSILPMAGEVPTQEQAELILKNLEGSMFGDHRGQFYMCPTYSFLQADIDYKRYWRGPVWINTNWLLYRGLLRYDFDDMAAKIRRYSLELIEKFGFYEYFDPRKNGGSNLGCGTNQFSWSAALCIDLLHEV